MKKLLRKKIGGKRHREWAWAAVFIALCVAGITLWAAQEPDYQSSASPINAGNVPGLGQTSSGSTVPAAQADTSVAGIIAGIPDASAFNSYLVSTGLAAQLHSGSYTIFVPTNAAFAAVPKSSIADLSAAAKKQLVEYHIVSGKMLDNDAIISGTYQAMSRDMLNFTVNIQTGISYVNSGKVLKQYKASNGIIYLVNSVLFPPR